MWPRNCGPASFQARRRASGRSVKMPLRVPIQRVLAIVRQDTPRGFRSCQVALLELQRGESRIQPVGGEQPGVRALGDDAPLVEHDDARHPLDGGQAMRDDERGASALAAAGHEIGEPALHEPLVLGVERAGRFVEQQHRGVAQHGARDRQPLPLAARKRDATLAHARLVTLRQALHEFVNGRGHRRRLHLGVTGAGAAVADVLGHGAGEDHRLLRHHGELRAQFGRIEAGDVDAVEQDAAGRRIEETQQQLEHGRLAGAGRPDQRHDFARLHREAEIVQRQVFRPRRIAETHAREIPGAPAPAAAAGAAWAGGPIAAVVARISMSRSVAPAARCTSPHNSLRAPTELASMTAYSTNCPSCPGLMRPASTSLAPIHSTPTMLAPARMNTAAVNAARARVRRMPVANAAAMAAP